MTDGELKFALHVEAALNCIPEPEYRQLIVEALLSLSLLSTLSEGHHPPCLNTTILVDEVVKKSYSLYKEEQVNACDRVCLL